MGGCLVRAYKGRSIKHVIQLKSDMQCNFKITSAKYVHGMACFLSSHLYCPCLKSINYFYKIKNKKNPVLFRNQALTPYDKDSDFVTFKDN